MTSRLLQYKKGDFAHALLAWRSPTSISLLAADAVQAGDVEAYRTFFAKEASLSKEMLGGQVLELDGIEESPMKVRKLASEASSTAATPQRWGCNKNLTDALQ